MMTSLSIGVRRFDHELIERLDYLSGLDEDKRDEIKMSLRKKVMTELRNEEVYKKKKALFEEWLSTR
jgi:hypothetical protein